MTRLHIAVLFFMVGLSAPAWVSAETIRLASGEWAPYTSVNLPGDGPSTELVRRAFGKVGVTVEIDYFPWARSYEYVVNGTYDGSLTWQKTPERERKVLFSDPVLRHQFVLFYNRGMAFEWQDVEDLKSYLIASVNGYSYGEQYDQVVHDNELMTTVVAYDIYALKMLATGRVQLFPSDVNVGYYLVEHELEEALRPAITHHSRILHEETSAVIFSQADRARGEYLRDLFNEGLQALRESGEYSEILNKAGLTTSIVPPDMK